MQQVCINKFNCQYIYFFISSVYVKLLNLKTSLLHFYIGTLYNYDRKNKRE